MALSSSSLTHTHTECWAIAIAQIPFNETEQTQNLEKHGSYIWEYMDQSWLMFGPPVMRTTLTVNQLAAW